MPDIPSLPVNFLETPNLSHRMSVYSDNQTYTYTHLFRSPFAPRLGRVANDIRLDRTVLYSIREPASPQKLVVDLIHLAPSRLANCRIHVTTDHTIKLDKTQHVLTCPNTLSSTERSFQSRVRFSSVPSMPPVRVCLMSMCSTLSSSL